eukprot:223865-Pleurochrysis_carterae.AAC.1
MQVSYSCRRGFGKRRKALKCEALNFARQALNYARTALSYARKALNYARKELVFTDVKSMATR